MLELTDPARITAALVLLSVVGIESGGIFLVRLAGSREGATDFQRAFYRAGHAHAGVLVTLGLVCLILTHATALTGFWAWLASSGVLVAAAVMSGGFFAAAAGQGRTRPSRWVGLLWLGATFLAGGVVTLGVGLLSA
ncbi:MAG: hypothetical protein GX593_04925 [Actinomycetales bacterium]|nr:hypothetical protein [Actinomycetales bacterium]